MTDALRGWAVGKAADITASMFAEKVEPRAIAKAVEQDLARFDIDCDKHELLLA